MDVTTRTPSGSSSTRRVSEIRATADLELAKMPDQERARRWVSLTAQERERERGLQALADGDLPAHTMFRAPSMELWLETTPLASISRGANAWTIARGPQTLTSYSLFASATSVSSSGLLNSTPALFTRTSRLPPVRFATISLHCAMVFRTVTSSSRISMSLSSARSAVLEGLRAVAKT